VRPSVDRWSASGDGRPPPALLPDTRVRPPIVSSVLETAYTGVLLLVLGAFAWICLYVAYRIYTGSR